MPQLSGFVTVDSAKIYDEISGEGAPLVLLHGNGEDHTYFKKQMPVFERYFRVIAVDTRGHGRSTRGTAPFTFEQFADDLEAVLTHLEIDRAHILGFSDGANLALLFAQKYLGRVLSLILNGANLNPKGVKLSTQIPIVIGYYLTRFFSFFSRKAKNKSEILGLMVNQPNILPASLEHVHVPALVIVGQNDMILPGHTQLIADSLPNSQLVVVPEADHFVARRMPGPFNSAVLRFLGR